MKQNKEFTMDNLLDPAFIDAKSESFYKKQRMLTEKIKTIRFQYLCDIFNLDNSAHRYIEWFDK